MNNNNNNNNRSHLKSWSMWALAWGPKVPPSSWALHLALSTVCSLPTSFWRSADHDENYVTNDDDDDSHATNQSRFAFWKQARLHLAGGAIMSLTCGAGVSMLLALFGALELALVGCAFSVAYAPNATY
jgi:hypothetical protein